MGRAGHLARSAGVACALVLGLSLGLSGCAALAPGPVVPPPPAAPVATETAPTRPPPAVSSPAPAPVATRPPEAQAGARVAILYSGGTPAQAAIANRIAASLTGPGWTVHPIDLDDPNKRGQSPDSDPIIAAVGPDALERARRDFAGADIVVSQVLGAATAPRRYVIAPTPPPSLQLAAWAAVDPGLARIGLITSDGFAATLPEAAAAATAIGAELVHRISTSDRETLYLFRRLAPDIDGLWLAPDSTILSTAIIGEILMLAAELDLSVLVFSEALLERGGLLSVSAPPGHVATLVVDAIAAIRAGTAPPAEQPLRQGNVRVNARIAAALGLPVPALAEWVIDEHP